MEQLKAMEYEKSEGDDSRFKTAQYYIYIRTTH
jgi:hypothetical protein